MRGEIGKYFVKYIVIVERYFSSYIQDGFISTPPQKKQKKHPVEPLKNLFCFQNNWDEMFYVVFINITFLIKMRPTPLVKGSAFFELQIEVEM